MGNQDRCLTKSNSNKIFNSRCTSISEAHHSEVNIIQKSNQNKDNHPTVKLSQFTDKRETKIVICPKKKKGFESSSAQLGLHETVLKHGPCIGNASNSPKNLGPIISSSN